MVRTTGSSGPRTLQAIADAALELIYRHGYEGMSLRQVAGLVGIQQGSLYNHFRSKQALLAYLYEEHMDRLTEALDRALEGLQGPVERLSAFVTFHVGYHVERKREVFVVNSELRSLEPDLRRLETERRKRYEQRLIAILEEGVGSGCFDLKDAAVTAFAILGMLSGICVWYDANGRLDRDTLVTIYRELVLNSVSARAAKAI